MNSRQKTIQNIASPAGVMLIILAIALDLLGVMFTRTIPSNGITAISFAFGGYDLLMVAFNYMVARCLLTQ